MLSRPGEVAGELAGYDFARRDITFPAGDGQNLRVHLVDTGGASAAPVVFLHGNPPWSYLWRHQIGRRDEVPVHAAVSSAVSARPSTDS